ncbi:MAG TPA: alpha/beta hydrolase-fold protein [Candidatus Acidoferrales bacterium]|nr:alpha/beta hydrolase-fold protein [Candidatus Acidoferrales bacterium]
MIGRLPALLISLWIPLVSPSNAWPQVPIGPVVMGETFQLPSKVLKESRTIFLFKPAAYERGTERYPVLYLLDGETHFRYTAAIADFLAVNDRIPAMLVVGIASGDTGQRVRDLTPPSTAETDSRFSPGNGGAGAFLAFLSGELIPYVDRTYRTRPYRILAGHSFGGLFAIYSLVTRPALFNGYIVADPSLYWNNQAIVAQAESFLSRTGPLQADLYLAATDLSDKIPSEVARLNAALTKSSPAGFRWKFDWMQEENHMSIPLPSIYRGLEAIFEEWRLADPLEMFNRGGIEAIHKRYRDAGRRFGYPERTTPAFTVSLVVAALIGAGRLEEASAVLLHDPAAYPPPWNQLDALARAYEKRGDTGQAVRYYRLSLKQNPRNDFAIRKLADLGIPIPDRQQD